MTLPKSINVYDPPMCCPTGVCGTEVDPRLIEFSEALAGLSDQGVAVTRFNLAQEPLAFTKNTEIAQLLSGGDAEAVLPVIVIDGVIKFQGVYPSKEQLLQGADHQPLVSLTPKNSSSCCDSSGCC
jgi:hypothetical protein